MTSISKPWNKTFHGSLGRPFQKLLILLALIARPNHVMAIGGPASQSDSFKTEKDAVVRTLESTLSLVPAPTVSLFMLPTCSSNAQMVKLQSTTGEPLHMFEVRVMSSASNLALNKRAVQSSTLGQFSASKSVDGRNNTFSHTALTDHAAHWEVDLGSSSDIDTILIFNRWCGNLSDTKKCLCRLSNATITLLDSDGSEVSSRILGNTCAVRTIMESFICPTPSECITPNGLDKLPVGVVDGIKEALDSGVLPFLFLPLIEPSIGKLIKAEAPIQFRLAQIHGSSVYHTVAKYHPTALNIWGKDVYRYCQDIDTAYLKVHEEIATALTFYYSAITLVPSSKGGLDLVLQQFGLDPVLLESNDGVSTPWGMAKFVVNEMAPTVVNDGWNADGKLATEYNVRPYSDFNIVGTNGVPYEQYEVEDNLGQTTDPNFWPWEPLRESDGLGYFTRQEHVTPFVGFTGRLYGMERSYYNSFMVPPPGYNYGQEATDVVNITRNMANNETKKMIVEFFNSKFTSLLPLQLQWSLTNGLSNFEFWFTNMVTVTTLYDAAILTWKEKVVYNFVRPTTVIHEIFGDLIIESYAGPYQGSRMMKGKDWQPYVRVRPHSEYPSGSACLCTTFAETMAGLSGNDDIGFPIQKTFHAGSSLIEPGVTPSVNITIEYSKWSQVAKECGQSRLWGGIHFSKAVTESHEMCSGFIDPVIKNAQLLKMGNASGALAGKDDVIEVTMMRKGSNKQSLLLG